MNLNEMNVIVDYLVENKELIYNHATFLSSDFARQIRQGDFKLIDMLAALSSVVYRLDGDNRRAVNSIISFVIKNAGETTLAKELYKEFYSGPISNFDSRKGSYLNSAFEGYVDRLSDDEVKGLTKFLGDIRDAFGGKDILTDIFYAKNMEDRELIRKIAYFENIYNVFDTYFRVAIVTKNHEMFDYALFYRACAHGSFYREDIIYPNKMTRLINSIMRLNSIDRQENRENIAELMSKSNLVDYLLSSENEDMAPLTFELWAASSHYTREYESKEMLFNKFNPDLILENLTKDMQIGGGSMNGNCDHELAKIYYSPKASDGIKARIETLVDTTIESALAQRATREYGNSHYGVGRETGILLNIILAIKQNVDFNDYINNLNTRLMGYFGGSVTSIITQSIEFASEFRYVELNNRLHYLYTDRENYSSVIQFRSGDELGYDTYHGPGRYQANFAMKKYGLEEYYKYLINNSCSFNRSAKVIFTEENIKQFPEMAGQIMFWTSNSSSQLYTSIQELYGSLDYDTLKKMECKGLSHQRDESRLLRAVMGLDENKNLTTEQKEDLAYYFLDLILLTESDVFRLGSASIRSIKINPLKVLKGKC